jgi:hypothetical protein
MKLNLQALSNQAIESSTGTKKMRLSEDSQAMVFQMFTKQVYSNPIGTVVREVTSNCFDSHIEANVNAPVLIKKFKDKDTDTIYISFYDYGVGISPERMDNIVTVLFESTKRIDNTQIGGFGIGFKTPLAYRRPTGHGEGEYDNSFFVITVYDKVKYYYTIFEGNESPEYGLLYNEPTDEGNGTEVRIPVLEKDVYTFEKEMVKQLYYFENVIFEGFDKATLSNEYQIIRGKNFMFRGTEVSEYIHVCLGRVAYPIKYDILGLNSYDYKLPIALKLEIGDANVTISREELDYCEATIKMLKKKLSATMKEITEMLAKQYNNITTLEQYFNVKNDFGQLEFGNGKSMYVGNLIEQKDVDFSNFPYSFMKMPNDKQLFKLFFDVKTYGKKPRRSRYSSSKYEFDGGYKELKANSNLYYISGDFNRKVVKQAYLKSINELYHIISKNRLDRVAMLPDICDLFNVHLDSLIDANGKPVDYVQSLIDMQDEYFIIVQKEAEDYDKLEIPDDFIIRRKNHKDILSKELRNSTIPVSFMGRHKSRVKLDKLFNYDCPIFYCTQEDETKLRKAHDLFTTLFDDKAPVNYYSDYNDQFNNGYTRQNNKCKNSIMFIMLANNNIKYMGYCKKAKKVDEFFTGMLLRRESKVTNYFQTYDIVDEWSNVTALYKSPEFAKVSTKWAKSVKEVETFINTLPNKTKSSNFSYIKAELSKYFDLSNIKQTGEQKRICKLIANVLELQEANEGTLKHINLPYRMEEAKDDFFIILKKIMAL